MQTFLISTVTVALAEIGDKTQLLSLILAAKYRKPWPICAGILLATLVNHALAGSVGALVAQYLTPEILKWITALSFFSVALWTLKPDSADDEEAARGARYGVMGATLIAFFIAEMGDKTQVATVVLAAEYHPLWQVVELALERRRLRVQVDQDKVFPRGDLDRHQPVGLAVEIAHAGKLGRAFE